MPPNLGSEGVSAEMLVSERAGSLAPEAANYLGSLGHTIGPLFSGLCAETIAISYYI